MANRKPPNQSPPNEPPLWSAASRFVADHGDAHLRKIWARAEKIRAENELATLVEIAEGLTAQGFDDKTTEARENLLTAALSIAEIYGGESGELQDLDALKTILQIAGSGSARTKEAVKTVRTLSASEAKGALKVEDRLTVHMAALTAEGLTSSQFDDAVKALYQDASLSASDRRDIALAVTRYPSKFMKSARAQREALHRWWRQKEREACRASDRAMETSRF
ncbi:MAG: hypothetical protein AAF909_12540 [Pseudomonadota bacterium]